MGCKRLVLSMILVISTLSPTQAQKEATNWFFGEKAGLTFSSGAPIAINNDGWSTYNACAVQSDPKTGDLLFYTNSEQVWNRYGQVMPGGNELKGNSSITQACLIVPNPANSQQYYLFTLANLSLYNIYDNTLSYSIIDIGLDGKKGDVVLGRKNQSVDDGLSEKLTAVPHKNGRDFWIISHHWDGNVFCIYLLTAEGIQKMNEIAIGSTYTFSKNNSSNLGYLQASPDGGKLACAVWKSSQSSPSKHPVDLFDFDAQTGTLSKYINLGLLSRQYGVCFSPDNTKLYVTHQTLAADSLNIDYVRQYDLAAGDAQAIVKSGMSIIIGNPHTNIPIVKKANSSSGLTSTFYSFALQNSINGKMYGTTLGGFCKVEDCKADYPHRFIVINSPNAKGFDCDIQLQTIDLREGSTSNASGLPNFLQTSFNNLQPITDSVKECVNESLTAYPNPTTNNFYLQYHGDCFTPYTLRLTNLNGQLLVDTTIKSPVSSAISIEQLPAGMYILEMTLNQHKVVAKIIKR